MAQVETVGVYQAKTHLPRLIERVRRGETITITRHGRPVAMLVPPSEPPRVDFEALFRRLDEVSRRVKPDPQGWTAKRYVEHGRP